MRQIKLARARFCRVLLAQCIVVFVVSCMAGLWADGHAAWVVLIGGGICLVPSAYFGWQALATSGAQRAQPVVLSLCKAEIVKIILTVGLFYVTLIVFKLAVVPILMGYLSGCLAFSLAPWLMNSHIIYGE